MTSPSNISLKTYAKELYTVCSRQNSNIHNQIKETFSPGSPTCPHMDRRRSSQPSTVSSSAGGADICRICHCEGDPDLPLISPCYCSGSLRYVHQSCLQQWIKSSDTRCCELCKFEFIMHTKIKPFRKWEKLEMSPVEQRKVLCSITFHVVAITCVVWSLYVLIDRTAEEMRTGLLEWPFWTKLIVVAIGFTGGLVFMYVQCKMYVQLFKRWRAFNRIIYVQNAPEKAAILAAELGSVLKVDIPDQEKRFSPDEEFHSCQSGSSETVNAVDQQPLERDPTVVVVVSSVTTSPTSTTLSLATTTTTTSSAATRTTITITENMFGDLPLRDTVLVTQQPPILVKEAVFEDEDNLTEIVVPQQQTAS